MSSNPEILSITLAKALADRAYERRKAAANELAALVQQLVEKERFGIIDSLIETLTVDFCMSNSLNSKKGGVMGIGSIAIGLGEDFITDYLIRLVSPCVQLFRDQDSRVRYFAAESVYNIVNSGDLYSLCFFNDLFEGLLILVIDPDVAVQNGARYLDKLLRDLITNLFSFAQGIVSPHIAEKLIAGDISLNNKELLTNDLPSFEDVFLEFVRVLKTRFSTRDVQILELLLQWITFFNRFFAHSSTANNDYSKEDVDHPVSLQDPVLKELVGEHGVVDFCAFLHLFIPQLFLVLDNKKNLSSHTKQLLYMFLDDVSVNSRINLEPLLPLCVNLLNHESDDVITVFLDWIPVLFSFKNRPLMHHVLAKELVVYVVELVGVTQRSEIKLDTLNRTLNVLEDLCEEFYSYSQSLSNEKLKEWVIHFEINETIMFLVQGLEHHPEKTQSSLLLWIHVLTKVFSTEVLSITHLFLPQLVSNFIRFSPIVAQICSSIFFTLYSLSDTIGIFSVMLVLEELSQLEELHLYMRRVIECLSNDFTARVLFNIVSVLLYDDCVTKHSFFELSFVRSFVSELSLILYTSDSLVELTDELRSVSFNRHQRSTISDFRVFPIKRDPSPLPSSLGNNDLYRFPLCFPEITDELLSSKDHFKLANTSVELQHTLLIFWSMDLVWMFSFAIFTGFYELGHEIVNYLSRRRMDAQTLLRLDQFIRLFESPAFAHVRVSLLNSYQVSSHILLKALSALLMLLPNCDAYNLLLKRLQAIQPVLSLSLSTYVSALNQHITKEEPKVEIDDDEDNLKVEEFFSHLEFFNKI
ncbi:hypothetical protein PCE1_001055 [Barthelona sp. PCE]